MKVKIGPYRKNRAYHVHIDNYDTWSADYTMATIIHPLLCKFRDEHQSYPDVDRYEDECYHTHDRQMAFEEILDRDAESKYYETVAEMNINEENIRYLHEKLSKEEKQLADQLLNSLNTKVFALRQEISQREAELIRNEGLYGSEHDAVKSTRKWISTLKSQLDDEIQNLISRGVAVADPIEYRQELIGSLLTSQATLAGYTVKADEYKKLIEEASQRVYEVAKRTDLDYAPQLSARHNNKIWLKREDQQSVFSYKIRGAYNLIASLSKEEQDLGVVTASAGNHAQGVALAANHLNLESIIVMPKTTPEIKIDSVKRMGAEVILFGNTYDDAKEHALELSVEKGMQYISPYDHPLVIAGQATVGVELLEQHPNTPDIIFVPVGGGGLVAGIAAYTKANNADIKIIGVEPDEAPCMHQAFESGKRIELEPVSYTHLTLPTNREV